jgi:glycosyltransferase involved in cell wall biosynthesis
VIDSSPTATIDLVPREPAIDRPRRLRVAQIVTNFTAGGGGVVLRDTLALDPDRFQCTIFAPEGGSLIEPAEEAGLEVIRLQHFQGGRRVYPWLDVTAYREIAAHLEARAYDLVHTHGARAGALGRVAAHRNGVPVIVHTLHGLPFTEFQSRATRRALCTIEQRLGKITNYFVAAGTMVASEAVRQRIAPSQRIRATMSPIDDVPPLSEASRRHARQLLGIPDQAIVIGTASRLSKQKGPLDMVNAMAALRRPDVYMVWLGDGDLRPQTERLIKQKGLESRFLLVGERTDVPTLLPAFDVFAMSSLWEGLPCAVIEAMTCGIPVVATAVNSVPEVVLAGKTGLLARPKDPSSLSQALAYMLDHPAAANRMAQAARIHVGEQYRLDLLGQELNEIYETALHLPPVANRPAHVASR